MSNLGAPLNYPDVVFDEDLDPFGNEIESDFQGLTQDVRHIIEQALGSNLDDLTKGAGLDQRLSGRAPDIISLAGDIDEQLRSDDRIDSSNTTITDTTQTGDAQASFSIIVEVDVNGQTLNLGWSYTPGGGLVVQGQ